MDETNLLLKAYYEALYELMVAERGLLISKVDHLLSDEITNRRLKGFDRNRFAAYRKTCRAFIDERTEMYNPVGFQYTFDRISRKQAAKLEMQLDWYDARQEFEDLKQAARQKATEEMSDERLRQLAAELINQVGAYPDNSVIRDYEAGPTPNRMPDYIVARAIEEVIRELKLFG